jgi:hypothetical protein
MLSNRQAHSLHFFSAVEIISAQTSLHRYSASHFRPYSVPA